MSKISDIMLPSGTTYPLDDKYSIKKSDLASSETGNTATAVHSEGSLVNWKNHLYVANSEIAIGDMLSSKLSEPHSIQNNIGFLNEVRRFFDSFVRYETKASQTYSITANGQTTVRCDPPTSESADLYNWYILGASSDNLEVLDVVGIYNNMHQVSVRSHHESNLSGRTLFVNWLGILKRPDFKAAT